jgi:hypothetical protein
MRWSTAGARKAELTGLAHGSEREKGGARQRLGGWRTGLAKQRERESERAK